MNNRQNTSIKIWIITFVLGIIFFIVTFFGYKDYNSAKTFLTDFFIFKNILIFWIIALFSVLIWFSSSLIIKNVFLDIEKYNKKLKDYNHYLAHELKTPISVIYSNLDVLKYWFDEEKINLSKRELKNMIKIIDSILNFSESIQITSKKYVNVENCINNYTYFLKEKSNITIENNEFNFSIFTDEILFERVIKNLIDNALKYSLDWKLKITIKDNQITFKNKITKTLTTPEINSLLEKFYSKSFEDKKWHGIGLPMIKEIVKILWYKLELDSKNNKFIVKILV